MCQIVNQPDYTPLESLVDHHPMLLRLSKPREERIDRGTKWRSKGCTPIETNQTFLLGPIEHPYRTWITRAVKRMLYTTFTRQMHTKDESIWLHCKKFFLLLSVFEIDTLISSHYLAASLMGAWAVPLPYLLTLLFPAPSSPLKSLTSLVDIRPETISAWVFLNLKPKPSCE